LPGKSIIVIGAGLAGLSTGCYAQMNGFQTKIFEHHSMPGGVAACWHRKDYYIDGGIHFLMGHRPGSEIYDMYRELGAVQTNPTIDLKTFGKFVDQASGKQLEVTADLARLERDLRAISPADAKVVDLLFSGTERMRKIGLDEMGLATSSTSAGIAEYVKMLWSMRGFMRFMIGKYGRSVGELAEEVTDPWLKFIVLNLFLPEVPVWFVLMFLRLFEEGQMGLLRNGCLDFVLAIEKRYKDLGGQATYDATVEKILVEKGCAVGVRLADGTEHRADIIVSAADGRSTIFDMLEGKYIDRKIKDRYDSWKTVRPVVAVSLGVGREFKEEPWMSIIRLKKPFEVGGRKIDAIIIRIFNYSDRFAPPGKTVVQASFETVWDHWNNLVKDKARYEAEKNRVAEDIIERLDAIYPGLKSKVEMTDVCTPYTTWRYTRNYHGSYMGWLPESKTITKPMKKTLPGLRNFYMVGQWAMPGGSVPTCIADGRGLVMMLCRAEGLPFVSST